MFCGKCGNNIDIPENYKSAFIVCPKCKKTISLQKRLVNTKLNTQKNDLSKLQNNDITKIQQEVQEDLSIEVVKEQPKQEITKKHNDTVTGAKVITAGKLQAGTKCSICKNPIKLGDKICICNFCQSTNHENCWKEHDGCSVQQCAGKLSAEERAELTQQKHVAKKEQMIACKWCGEKIRKGTVVCEHCGESQFGDDDMSYYKYDDSGFLEKREYFIIFITPLLGFKFNLFSSFFLNTKFDRSLSYSNWGYVKRKIFY